MRQEEKIRIPASFKSYFWDVDFDTIDPQKHAFFILKRVLDRGDTKAVRWALTHYDRPTFVELITTTHDISRKTANFWADMLDIDRKKVPCLQKPYVRTPFGLSN